MSRRIAIATCSAVPDLDADARLLAKALQRRGAEAEPLVWDSGHQPFGASPVDAVILRSTWDYQYKVQSFLRWAKGLSGRLYNDFATVAWNIDKRYLVDLREARIPIVPSTFVDQGASDLQFPDGMFVVKPTVSAGSKDTAVYDEDRLSGARAHVRGLQREGRTALIQPYLDHVDTQGETAVILIDGLPCHAMRKDALMVLDEPLEEGLFRQEVMSLRVADEDILALARRACEWVSSTFGLPLYARVDILRDQHGQPVILELELIEPSLFLDFYPPTADVLAQALLQRLG
jgi:glutathione synthase/RimK-type ligase-like ATP-grasp enzyme